MLGVNNHCKGKDETILLNFNVPEAGSIVQQRPALDVLRTPPSSRAQLAFSRDRRRPSLMLDEGYHTL